MEKIFIAIIMAGLLLLPSMVFGQSSQMSTGTPPVAQPLVREGDFAVKLVDTLKIGTAKNEAEAETMLSSSGIAPKNGWIADYPVTPDIIGELQNAIGDAADSKKLPMSKDEALKAFHDLTASLNLSIVADTSGSYAGSEPPTSYPDYSDPSVINDYYYDEGPPVVSYYPPPWDYYYMYGWVPYPFWWSGFFFRGFFVLNDFHKVISVGHRKCLVTNHFFDRKTNRTFAIDPVRRRTGESFRTTDISRNKGFDSAEGRRGAGSIFERSRERINSGNGADSASGRGLNGRSMNSRRSEGRSEEHAVTRRGNSTLTHQGRGDGSVKQPTPERGISRDQAGTALRGSVERNFGQSGNIERRSEMNSQRPFVGEGRSSSAPSRINERSFSSPPMSSSNFNRSESSGRSFSAPNRSSERSFNSPSTGSRSFGSSQSSGRTFSGSGPSRSFSGSSSRGSSFSCQNCHGGSSSFGRGGGGTSSRSFSGGGFSGGRSSGGLSGGGFSRGGGGFSGGRGGGGGRGR
jgi:hypothetical protein